MKGKLILVSGLSGAGKTTLIGGALKQLLGLAYLKTYTTRPAREGEAGGHDYVFVDESEYARLRKESSNWDHTEYGGFMYGADVDTVRDQIKTGTHIICNVTPDMNTIDEMTKLYATETATVWIKVPKDVAKQRIYQDDIRDSRNEDFAISTNFDYIFEPIGVVEPDVTSFVALLNDILKSN